MVHLVRRPALVAGGVFIAVALLSASCSSNDSSSGGGGPKIALLLPETKTTRYESQDRPLFEARVKELCGDCTVAYSNADQDATKQVSQAEAAITNGAKVLVLDPVDSNSASAIVGRAKQSNIPVIAYDRLIKDAPIDYYISFDNQRVGELQGQALVDKLKADGKGNGTIVMINGAATDNNAGQFKAGALKVIEPSGLKIGATYDTPDWSPDKAQTEMEQSITALGKDGFVGVYAANDGTAGGAIAAMKGAGISPIPPTTGQDAELAGIQRILAGEQYMTVYKAVKPEAQKAAELAVALARNQSPPSDLITGTTDNGNKQVPSIILTPVAVTKDNINDTVVKDGFWKASEICTGAYQAYCTQAGIA